MRTNGDSYFILTINRYAATAAVTINRNHENAEESDAPVTAME